LPSLEPEVLRKLISYAWRMCLHATTVPGKSANVRYTAAKELTYAQTIIAHPTMMAHPRHEITEQIAELKLATQLHTNRNAEEEHHPSKFGIVGTKS
jgi:hypothetical protein